MSDAALDLVTLNLESHVWSEHTFEEGGSFGDGIEFGPPGAPDGDAAGNHRMKNRTAGIISLWGGLMFNSFEGRMQERFLDGEDATGVSPVRLARSHGVTKRK